MPVMENLAKIGYKSPKWFVRFCEALNGKFSDRITA